jgi:hypothetical protein
MDGRVDETEGEEGLEKKAGITVGTVVLEVLLMGGNNDLQGVAGVPDPLGAASTVAWLG